MSREVLPGRNTSPWMVDAVLATLKRRHPSTTFTLADSDVAGYPPVRPGLRTLGLPGTSPPGTELGSSTWPTRTTARWPPATRPCPVLAFPLAVFQGGQHRQPAGDEDPRAIGRLLLPEKSLGAPASAALPVPPASAPRSSPRSIARCPKRCSTSWTPRWPWRPAGPRPDCLGSVGSCWAGRDRVAVDAAALDYMDFSRAMAPHVALSQEAGVGSMDHAKTGDPLEPAGFIPPQPGQDLVSLLERRLRAIPGLGKLLYRPEIAPLAGLGGAPNTMSRCGSAVRGGPCSGRYYKIHPGASSTAPCPAAEEEASPWPCLAISPP